MFALDEELARWQAELSEAQGWSRLPLLTALAWHLRQREPLRAQSLSADIAALLDQLPPSEAAVQRARLLLIAAEAQWLSGELDHAEYQAGLALQQLELADDLPAEASLVHADACWVLAWIANDRGASSTGDHWLAQAALAARAGGDPVRVDVIDAASGICHTFSDWKAAQQRWSSRFSADLSGVAPIAAGWISDFFGTCAFQRSDYGRAIGHLMLSYETALATGQIRRAIIVATNIGNGFTSLNAHEAALDWMQRGLDLARPTGWPLSIGMCLMQTAETLRQLGQREAAQTLLREALNTLAPLSGSRAYAVALEYQGDLALDLGNHAAALDSFTRLASRGDALGQTDFQSSARRGQAHALSHLARPEDALAAAQSALALAREHADASSCIAALNVLADIHTRHQLPPPAEMQAANPVLHYLQLALETAATIEGYTVPGALLDATAREYAAIGDHERAYAIALQASAARDQTHSQQATNRAIAMQVQYQTERAQTEGEHHRQLAAAEAQRAEVLQQTSATLEHLSAIGQEITAHLDAAAVFRALDRHVHGLLDATHFSVFLLEPGEEWLACAFGVEAGKPLPAVRVPLSDPNANSARCMRERREIMIELGEADVTPNLIPGTLPTLSLLFAPLRVGERVLGVMTVQSLLARAYGERERLIFRTLCAYGAIALDNASAYRQVAATLKTLSATQEQLLEKNLELERAYKALEEVSLTDQLTGLRNRRFFLQNVDADVAMSLRGYDTGQHRQLTECDLLAPNDLVFFMVDLDHFKEVNDRYGHAAGDSILVQMQERLREVFRESDYVIRWGGEEFLVLARATHRDEARVVAERMRRAVADRDFELPDGVRLAKTCSIGFACFPFLPEQPRLLSWSQVVELADQGLYIAKRSGRNAWAAVYSTAATQPEGIFPRLMQQLDQAVADGEVRLVSNLTGPLVLGGERRRVGLSSDLET
ncbi:sensor domain-containing diguanylate cyclase [Duganella sp. HH101]|uniref:sensor domain-containing diguanylate cyclase n=1 Tax=Duganella sp. HH101 TaxID=1781066 RepID=UPI000874545A|nr:sensor domain-containing diguanylate cyclase [Duganella sp. HH101]OEZ95919.1 diguanylate cyclase DosC [Duganella sp. HH101]